MRAPLASPLALALVSCLLLVGSANGRALAQRRQRLPTAGGAVLTTSIARGDAIVACKTFSPYTLTWGFPTFPEEFIASGNTQPPYNDTELICQSPTAAGARIQSAVAAGGLEAQTAVYALFNADCTDPRADQKAYTAAVDAVNSGNPVDLQAVSDWMTKLAAAADAVGIPLCASLAVVDEPTGTVLEQHAYHTGVGAGATGPAAEAMATPSENITGLLTTSVAYSAQPVFCDTWDPDTFSWTSNTSAEAYGSTGYTMPSAVIVQALMDQVCSSPLAAGSQLQAAVAAGGEEAQYWTYALLDANCVDPSAQSDAYNLAIDAVNSGSPEDLETTSDWFTNLAAAADAVGIPLCASLAVVDEATGAALEQLYFHTGS